MKLTQKLIDEWEAKLKESGFKDAEHTVRGTRNLITSSNPFRNHRTEEARAKVEYFTFMYQHAYEEKYSSKVGETIMHMFVEGRPINEIAYTVKRYRGSVRKVIQKYEKKWGIGREWNKHLIK